MLLDFYSKEMYELNKQEKEELLTQELEELTILHIEKYKPYAIILKGMGYNSDKS